MPIRPHYLDELLLAHLQAFLGKADPATLALLQRQLVWIDLLRPRSQRRYRLPSLTNYLMNVTSLYSSSRQVASRLLTDVYIRPELSKVGMLQWDRFAPTVQQGYAHALQVLDAEKAGKA